MMQPLLLDTCAAVWVVENEKLAPQAIEVLRGTHEAGLPTYVSPITAWEIGLLASHDRLKLLITPQRWFGRLLATPTVRLADLSPDLLIASSFLPGRPPRDPADRIIAATARDYGCILMTRDRALLDYGEQGHIRVIAC
jgi:PIN domain nuclease of toxin-antitoxin system